ncbi:MAG TPA: MBL fold metallo-hydrolase [Thermoleophilaceae bacterium]|jgi:glyoxylase-like metal-dependent hydrolase (beta-lactamase superfamily II)|nr:MBL fold metallo-hydrolase [Thermoleophilaceae bacterium]
MTELAPDVHLLTGFPKYGINWYLVGDVLIDAGGKPDKGRILKQLRGRNVTAHALTHAHPDHQGASNAVCTELGIPFLVPERDIAAAEDPNLINERQPRHFMPKLMFKLFAGPGRKVDQALHEGDEVAGFTVLDTPGHSAGHVSYWRESDRVLICGDVINTMHPFLMTRGVREPFDFFTPDPAENRRSIKRIAGLDPALVLVGHGPPLRDTQQLKDLAARLA